MLLAPVVAAIAVVSVRAAEPFPAGYTLNKVAHSGYVDFVRAGEPVCDIEVLFGEGKPASLNVGEVR